MFHFKTAKTSSVKQEKHGGVIVTTRLEKENFKNHSSVEELLSQELSSWLVCWRLHLFYPNVGLVDARDELCKL